MKKLPILVSISHLAILKTVMKTPEFTASNIP